MAGPDAVLSSADLGPISPELVLIDPVLAEQARKLLPDPALERPRPRMTVTPLEVAAEPVVPPPQRHRGRTVVLAGLIFAAGAASGNFLAERHASSAPGVTFAEQLKAIPTQSTQATKQTKAGKGPAARRTSTRKHPALRPPTAATKKRRPAAAGTKPHRRAARKITWAANVLGVTARVASPGVTIAWKRPANSSRVVVLRARGARRHGVVVFRGRATTYRDGSPRRCTAYRYTIVNYDRRGHRSTGVPTSIVTGGCA